jgi:structural maintenance of chromosome 2
MKPQEVLAMLEEATGVRLYEDQKTKALKTLAQKQGKVDEMDKGNKETSCLVGIFG